MNSKENVNETAVLKPDFSKTLSRIGLPGLEEEKNRQLAEVEDLTEFPVSVYPEKLQAIIEDLVKGLSFNLDYIAACFLSAASTAIGATHKVKVKESWLESAIIFMAIVGPPGANKSAPLSYSFKPFEEEDADNFLLYIDEIRGYEAAKMQNAKVQSADEVKELKKPSRRQLLAKDITTEALYSALHNNPRGIGLVNDELASWFKNFNKYNSSGSNEEVWLSFFSNKGTAIDRKSGDPILISNPNINVIGSMQPVLLKMLFSGDRAGNGFSDRICFVMPEEIQPTEFSFKSEPDRATYSKYQAIIKRLLALDFSGSEGASPHILKLSSKAQDAFLHWSSIHRQIINNRDTNYRVKGIYSKMETYCFRFALVMQLLYWACEEGDRFEIEERAMDAAIKITEYFKHTAIRVLHYEKEHTEKVDKKAVCIQMLPQMFSTGEGVEVAKTFNISPRAFKGWLNDTEIFTKLAHGKYQKNNVA